MCVSAVFSPVWLQKEEEGRCSRRGSSISLFHRLLLSFSLILTDSVTCLLSIKSTHRVCASRASRRQERQTTKARHEIKSREDGKGKERKKGNQTATLFSRLFTRAAPLFPSRVSRLPVLRRPSSVVRNHNEGSCLPALHACLPVRQVSCSIIDSRSRYALSSLSLSLLLT